MEYLSSPQMLSDPRNHTVPFSHVTGIGYGKSIIAMPKLLSLDDIPLSSLRTAQCYDLLRQIVEGFSFLHGHGVAHMDLKSANIVTDTSLGRWYIIDFGLAYKVNGPDDTVVSGDSEGRSSGLHPKSKTMAMRTARFARICGPLVNSFELF